MLSIIKLLLFKGYGGMGGLYNSILLGENVMVVYFFNSINQLY